MGKEELKTKVLVFYMVNCFLNGVENYIILPSSLYYITYLDSTKAFLGMVLAMRSFGYIVGSPFVGKLADNFNGDIIFFLGLLVHAVGNLIYSVPISAYFPLFGRLIMGFGASTQTVSYGELARKSPPDKLAVHFVMLSAMYSLGTCLGPVFGALLGFKITIYKWVINPGNSPAAVMMIVWVCLSCVWQISFPSKCEDNRSYQYKEVSMKTPERDEKVGRIEQPKQNWSTLVCLLYLSMLVGWFNATAEISVPTIANSVFNLSLFSIKMIFANGIALVSIAFVVSYIAKTWFDDRFIYTLTVALQVISPLFLGIIAVFWEHFTIFGAFMLVPLLTFGMVAEVSSAFGRSLLNRVVKPCDRCLYQSIFSAMFHVGSVVSSGVFGLIFKDAPFSLIILSNVSIVMWIGGIVWLIVFGFKHL